MAYISTEEVKVIREELKAAFPASEGWKFSVVRDHHSSVTVAIMEAPIDFLSEEGKEDKKYFGVHGHGKGYKNSEVFEKVWNICNKTNFDKSDSMTDYFHVGFYFDLYVGKWDKAFQVSKKATKSVAA